MSFTTFNSQHNPLFADFNSFHISHDGEGDDIQSLVIASWALKNEDVEVDCVIGNPDIVHAFDDKSNEMYERMTLTNQVFGRNIAIRGAESNDEISKQYVSGILKQSTTKKCLVLHTDSFKSLQDLFNYAKPGQLKNVVILTYGSVNLSWAMPNPENYQPFYNSLADSGAKLVQVEGFPFLGTRNKLTHKNTPLTYSLLQHLDGPAGQKWKKINASATEKVRKKQVAKIAEYICQGINKASLPQQKKLRYLVLQIMQLFDSTINDIISNKLEQILDQSLVGKQHDLLKGKLEELSELLISILNVDGVDLKRPFNIYTGTSLQGQALIADQIPAIIFSELVEKRDNGIAKECLPVRLDGFNGRFAKFTLSEVKSSLYYLDTKMKIEQSSSAKQETELIDSYLKYIDLCMAKAILVNNQMITSSKKNYLFSTEFKNDLIKLSKEVQALGFDLPKE